VTDLGPYEEDVKFAWEAASKLKHEFERTAHELSDQARARRKLADHAKDDWHGRYVSVFERQHMSCTLKDAAALSKEMLRCAQMLHELSNLAREEDDRRKLARAWKVEHDKWEREHDGGIVGFFKDLDGNEEPKPPDLPEIKPQPMVADSPPSSGHRG
jgi:hypothetical protein